MITLSDSKQIALIQGLLGTTADGVWGPKSQAALDKITGAVADPVDPIEEKEWHVTTATSFADPADIEAFEKCKAKGNTDNYCFQFGDNGIGCWGDSTVAGTGPCCALPKSAWEQFGSAARKKKVLVQCNQEKVVCELKDTSGSRDVVDLNPDACEALGLTPPVKEPASWRWVEPGPRHVLD